MSFATESSAQLQPFAEHGLAVKAMPSTGWISDTWAFYCLYIVHRKNHRILAK